MNRTFLILIVSLACVGCRNSLHIRVDRVIDGPTAKLQQQSPVGRKVISALQALSDLDKQYGELVSTSTNLIEALLGSSQDPDLLLRSEYQLDFKVSNSLQPHLNHMEQSRKQIALLENSLNGYFERTDALGLASEIDFLLLRVIRFFEEEKRWLADFRKDLIDLTIPHTTESGGVSPIVQSPDIDSMVERSTRLLSATRDDLTRAFASTSRDGFGGFKTIGVAELDPSDPAYERVLNKARSRTSADPLSSSEVYSWGDSSIMIVEESSAQFRTYQLSNNPETLLQNVSALVSKATAAAAKYFTGGLAP